MNIILEWLDLTWKSSITKKLSKELWLKLITKNMVSSVLWDIDNIKDWEYITNLLNSEENCVFDRHFLSLLVYWNLTNRDLYYNIVDEEKIFSDFIESNKWWIIVFRHHSYNSMKNKLNWRINNSTKELSLHDLNMWNLDYFNRYCNTFHSIFNRLRKYNENSWKKVFVAKQDASKIFTKKSVKTILYYHSKIIDKN